MSNFLKKSKLAALGLLVFAASFFVSVNSAGAQSDLLAGQNHFYTVVFRGNGEAIVYAKLVVTNNNDTALREYSFQMPDVKVGEMVIYQMKQSSECIRYDNSYRQYNWDETRPCLEYRSADYLNSYYNSNVKNEYQKVNFTQSGNQYKFYIPTAVQPGQTTAFVVAFSAQGFVDKFFGLFKYNFETLKVPSRIQEVKVSVSVDSDLYMEGKKAEVNYNESSSGLGLSYGVATGLGASSATYDRKVSTIGTGGTVQKSAKNLAPDENFSVKGEYAKSSWRLYANSIIFFILIFVGCVSGIYLLLKRYAKMRPAVSQQAAVNRPVKVQHSVDGTTWLDELNFRNAIVGLISAALLVVTTTGLGYLLDYRLLNRILPNSPIVWIMIFIIFMLWYIFIIFGPALFMSSKYGKKASAMTLVAELLWLILMVVVFVLIFSIFVEPINSRPNYYY